MPPYYVEYYCPAHELAATGQVTGNYWESPVGGQPYMNVTAACGWADALKPPRGHARVVSADGLVVYFI